MTIADVRAWIAAGRLQPADSICTQLHQKWVLLSDSELAGDFQPKPKDPQDEVLNQMVQHMIEYERSREDDRLTAAYRSVFELLNERYITQCLNRRTIFEVIDPPEPVFDRFFDTFRIMPAPDATFGDMERFWNSLRVINNPLAFDLVSTAARMYFRFSSPEGNADLIEEQLRLNFPNAVVVLDDDPEEMINSPLRCVAFFPQDGTHFLDASGVTRDPYKRLFDLLDGPLASGDVTIQVLCCPLPDAAIPKFSELLSWKEPGIPLDVLMPYADETYSAVIPEYVDEKNYLPHNILETIYDQIRNKSNDYAPWMPLANQISVELTKADQYYTQGLQMKARLEKKPPAWVASVNIFSHDERLIDAIEHRYLRQWQTPTQRWKRFPATLPRDPLDHPIVNWNIVSTTELASFAHFPTRDATSERLEMANMKQKLPPEQFTTGQLAIGESEARGVKRAVALPEGVRDRHLYIVGKSGTGKSTLIFNAALQDIQRGDGVAVIDPHGDLVASGEHALLHYIPKDRVQDTIYLNASDKEFPIGLNLLKVAGDEELDLLATNLQTTFRRLSDSWGERMDNVLRFALHTLVQTPNTTFFDLKKLLQNKGYRNSVVGSLRDPRLIDFWENDFASSRDSVQPIINRMGKFMLSALYGMLSQAESKLNFFELIQKRKILLVNLGGIGEDDAQLLGSLLVSQLQLAVMQRAKLPMDQRHPFYLYVDEFQNFTSRAFAKILSEARKYRLCLTLAHQFISQLGETERDAIFGNIGTMIMFGVGDKDAQALRHQLGSFEALDLANLPKYHALVRPDQASQTFSLMTYAPPQRIESYAKEIIAHTRAHYCLKPPDAETLDANVAHAVKEEALDQEVPLKSNEPSAVLHRPITEETPGSESPRPFEVKETPPSPLPQPALGRGGQQHKYLQQLIKRLAEDKGYRAVIEEPVLAGVGSVDVALQKDGRRIACEISVSSTCDYEFQNVQKCLAAGFDQIVVLSSERKTLKRIHQLVESNLGPEGNRVLFFQPEEFILFLEQTEMERQNIEKTVRGYKVNVKYKQAGRAEDAAQRQAVTQVILKALKRMKSDN